MKLMLLTILVFIAAYLFFMKGGSKGEPELLSDSGDDLVEPEGWPKLQSILDEHALPGINISLIEAKPREVSQSRFGGRPYWPRNKTYPVDRNGTPLNFLAQINFSEIPEPLKGYPQNGILQFYIANDDLYGLEFFDEEYTFEKYLNNKKNFAVIYHSDVGVTVEKFSSDIEKSFNNDMSPYSGESAIEFRLARDLPSPVDYRFAKIIESYGELDDETEEYVYEKLMKTPDHKIGGYASFTQDDPRNYYDADANWLLLFQIDTDSNEKIDIMWGDAGIANFFIRPEDLKNLNFNNVWYNWDCH